MVLSFPSFSVVVAVRSRIPGLVGRVTSGCGQAGDVEGGSGFEVDQVAGERIQLFRALHLFWRCCRFSLEYGCGGLWVFEAFYPAAWVNGGHARDGVFFFAGYAESSDSVD